MTFKIRILQYVTYVTAGTCTNAVYCVAAVAKSEKVFFASIGNNTFKYLLMNTHYVNTKVCHPYNKTISLLTIQYVALKIAQLHVSLKNVLVNNTMTQCS